ncbi:MAG: DegT/DnrJ/EryC1/StrS family aminotransferase, partial [Nanoarchaeota archaeon]
MIPIFDLKRQYGEIKEEIDSAISRVMESGFFILGEEVRKFEEEFAKYIGTKYCIGVANGTDALTISLKARGIGNGDEVITVANTASPTVMAILNVGAKPVLVDCNDFYNIDVDQIEEKITDKTKAILPVHLYGQPADMNGVKKISEKNQFHIIEDVCQAHGSDFDGKKTGSFGDGCFSFYPTKNLGCYGDGGAITTNDKEFAEKCRMLRFYGQKETAYNSLIKGYNSRLDELQAAILREKLKHLDEWNKKRKTIVKLYNELLKKAEVPKVKENANHVFHLYVVRSGKRDALREFLKSQGIGTSIHYPFPIHHQKAFGIKESFPKTEQNSKEIISLPIYP